MQPRGPLMVEHRLIERMIALMDKEEKKIERNNSVNPSFIDAAVDFLRTYADETHHGKEEKILFRDLAKKKLSIKDTMAMNELIEDHGWGRAATAELVDAHEAYKKGDAAALISVTQALKKFVDFYPKHIKKEDKLFFPAAMAYLSNTEQKSMLIEFREFDMNMIHEKYKSIVDALEQEND